jgi:hypothetical protein
LLNGAHFDTLGNSNDTVAVLADNQSIVFDSVRIGQISTLDFYPEAVYVGIWITSSTGKLSGTLAAKACKDSGSVLNCVTIATLNFSKQLQIDSSKAHLALLPVSISVDGIYNLIVEATGLNAPVKIEKVFLFCADIFHRMQTASTYHARTDTCIRWHVSSYCRVASLDYSLNHGSTWNTIVSGNFNSMDSAQWHVPDTSMYGVQLRLTYFTISLNSDTAADSISINVIQPGAKTISGPFVAFASDSTSSDLHFAPTARDAYLNDSSWFLFRKIDFAYGLTFSTVIRAQTQAHASGHVFLFFDSLSGNPAGSIMLADTFNRTNGTISLGQIGGVHDLYLMTQCDTGTIHFYWMEISVSNISRAYRPSGAAPKIHIPLGQVMATCQYMVFPFMLDRPGLVVIQLLSLAGKCVYKANLVFNQAGHQNFESVSLFL